MKSLHASWQSVGLMLIAASALAAPGLSFRGLGLLAGTDQCSPAALSGDGSVVIGTCSPSDESTIQPFRWDAVRGLQGLEIPQGETECIGLSISGDGAFAAGTCDSGGTERDAFRWDAANGMQGLGVLAGTVQSVANAVTRDGAVIVGESDSADFSTTKALRWDVGNGLQDLGSLSGLPICSAAAVSTDGSFVAGTCKSSDSASAEAFRWDATSGMMHGLGAPPGRTRSYEHYESEDGTIAIGDAYAGDGTEETFRWDVANGIAGLGLLPGLDTCYTTSTSGDGSLVTGICSDTGAQLPDEVFVWDAQDGMRDLQSVVVAEGNDLTGWRLTFPIVSADGRSFAGAGIHMGHYETWVAPEASASGDCLAAVVWLSLLACRAPGRGPARTSR